MAINRNCFVETPPDFTFRNGVFVVTVTVCGETFDCVYTPHTFLRAHAKAQAAVDAFYANDAEQIKLA